MKSSSSQAEEFSKVAFLQLESSLLSSNKSSHQKNKKGLTKLNLFGKGITFIKQLSEEETETLKCVKEIDLSHNALASIENIKCLPIEILNLSHNKFIEEEQFVKIFLKKKNSELAKNMTKIILKGNPFIKKSLSAETRRWLFSIENDLEINSREEQEYLELLVQRQVEKLTLESMLHRMEMNLEFVKVYDVKLSTEEYERLILVKPEDYFKLIRRQMEWKFQEEQPFAKVRKFVVNQLPLELFNLSSQQRPHSSIKAIATNLVLELKKRNELLIKTNKELMTKIENVVFNYLTQRKMLVEKKATVVVEAKGSLLKVQGIKTPMKNLKNSEVNVQVKDEHQYFLEPTIIKKEEQFLTQPEEKNTYPEMSTPIYIKKPAPQSTIEHLISKGTEEPSNPRHLYNNNLRNTESSRNPFEEIISEVDRLDVRDYIFGSEQGDRFEEKEKHNKEEEKEFEKERNRSYHQYNRYEEREQEVLRENNNNKENIIKIELNNNNTLTTSTAGMKKAEVTKAASKTLFELSQSLLQKPIIPPSDESLHFDLEEGLAESQIEKMFFTILTKINPIFHLLYSPLTSLKMTEMSQLIENLLELLKEKMKYVEKLERYKVMYENEKQKSEELMNVGKKTKENKDVLMEKNEQLTKEMRSLEKEFERLSSELQSKAQENFILREENEKLHFEGNKFNDIRYERHQEEDMEEKIISLREERLKKTYMNDICLRAKKFFVYKEKMAEINEEKKRLLFMECFGEWKGEARCETMYRQLNKSIMTKSINIFTNTTSATIKLRKQEENSTKELIKAFTVIRLKNFLKKLSLSKESIENHEKSEKHYQKSIKRNLFSLLKENRECEKLEKQNEIVLEFRKESKQRLKRWVFDEWLIWQRGMAHKEIEVRVNHEGILACNVVEKLCNFYSYEKSFQAKSLALELYLKDIRKINSFHKLLHEMSLKVQAWKLKLFKINMFTKRAYFDNFLSGIRRVKNKRRIKEKDEEKLRKKMLFNEMKETKLKRSFIREKFRRVLKEGISQCIKNNIEEFKKEIVTEKMEKRIKCESFFDSLRIIHRKKMALRLKQKEVSFISKRYLKSLESEDKITAKSFFTFMRSSLRLKHNLINFFIRKNKELMQRTFYQFRISCLEQKSQFFEEKLKELGPDIELIEERQIETNIEKISLTREIESKNQQILDYEKEVCELRLLLEAKEIKYEKLKDIYAESIDINSRGRDIYEDIEKSLVIPPEIGYYDTGYMNIVDDSKASSFKESESKYVMKTVRQEDSQKKPRVYNYTKYSPERDIKLTERRKEIGLSTKKKETDSKDINKSSFLMSNNSNLNSKEKMISDFYPSFRRF